MTGISCDWALCGPLWATTTDLYLVSVRSLFLLSRSDITSYMAEDERTMLTNCIGLGWVFTAGARILDADPAIG